MRLGNMDRAHTEKRNRPTARTSETPGRGPLDKDHMKMKISTAIVSSLFALSLVAGGSAAYAKSGKVESVENGGRVVVIAGTKYKISGSRTKVSIGGKPGDRGQIKVGMTCDAKGSGTAKTVDCK